MVAFWHYGRLLVTLKAARPTRQSVPEPQHWRATENCDDIPWLKRNSLPWYPYSMISIKTTLAWHKDIWVSQCSPKMPFILKILPLSLSPFKSKNTGIFLYYGEILLKGSQPFDLWSPSSSCHRQHEQCSLNTIINMNIIIKIITIIIARSVLPGGDGDLNRSCRSRSGSLHGRLSEVLHLSFLIEYSHP